jgi:hypothetical protein
MNKIEEWVRIRRCRTDQAKYKLSIAQFLHRYTVYVRSYV